MTLLKSQELMPLRATPGNCYFSHDLVSRRSIDDFVRPRAGAKRRVVRADYRPRKPREPEDKRIVQSLYFVQRFRMLW